MGYIQQKNIIFERISNESLIFPHYYADVIFTFQANSKTDYKYNFRFYQLKLEFIAFSKKLESLKEISKWAKR